jgi:hypothetical protein
VFPDTKGNFIFGVGSATYKGNDGSRLLTGFCGTSFCAASLLSKIVLSKVNFVQDRFVQDRFVQEQ